VVLLTGDDRAGVNEVLHRLHEWMDARYIQTHAFSAESDEGPERPRLWRYWNALPRNGQLAIFVGDWSTSLLVEAATGELDEADFERGMEHIECFEQELVESGALLLKFWIHLPGKRARKQRKKARKAGGPEFRSDALDRRVRERHDEILAEAEGLIRRTSTAAAPWQIVDGSDEKSRDFRVAETILAALRSRLDAREAAPVGNGALALPDADARPSVLSAVDLGASLPYDDYKSQLDDWQQRLHDAVERARRKRVAAILVFEGWDAAGKGGAIRRITRALDARDYQTAPIAAPTEEEKAHHHLWRFWRKMPRDGRIAIFDRSWYGRVLVERVEGFASDTEWRRAYAEINDFEAQLVEHGSMLCKFWLHIDPDEQLKRFRAREKTPYKKYKIGPDDYRNRGKWDAYVEAVDEMAARTSFERAPWHMIPANDKRFARVAIVRTVAEALRAGVKRA
jgi:polyphosphate:AMP phosphotransferase